MKIKLPTFSQATTWVASLIGIAATVQQHIPTLVHSGKLTAIIQIGSILASALGHSVGTKATQMIENDSAATSSSGS